MPHHHFPTVLANYLSAPLKGSSVTMNLQSAPFFGSSSPSSATSTNKAVKNLLKGGKVHNHNHNHNHKSAGFNRVSSSSSKPTSSTTSTVPNEVKLNSKPSKATEESPAKSESSSSSSSSSSSKAVINFIKLRKQTQHFFDEFLWFLRVFGFLCIACNTLFVGVGIAVIPFLLFETSIALAFLCIIITLYLPTYLGDPATTGRRKWASFQNGIFIKDLIKYFSGDLVKTEDIPAGKYIFAVAPHGVVVIFFLFLFIVITTSFFPFF